MTLLEEPAVAWAMQAATRAGCPPTGPVEPVRLRPWSRVYRFRAGAGAIYLKIPAPIFSLDGPLIELLSATPGMPLPVVLASGGPAGAFLMEDAGRPLRDALREGVPPACITDVLRSYGLLQVASSRQVAEMQQLGLPDWHTGVLPSLYAGLLADGFLSETEGMTSGELAALRDAEAAVVQLCSALASCGIPAAVEHGDFHDNNVLIGADGLMVVSDFGDAVISHPFFSMVNFAFSCRLNHGAAVDGALAAGRAAYLDAWRPRHAEDCIMLAYRLAERLGTIRYAVGYRRLWEGLPRAEMNGFRGKVAASLRTFLSEAATTR